MILQIASDVCITPRTPTEAFFTLSRYKLIRRFTGNSSPRNSISDNDISIDPFGQDIELQDTTFTSLSPSDLTPKTKMKFSHSLQFNAVPEWSSKYINYSTLKKVAYNLQKQYVQELNSKNLNEEASFTSDPNDPANPVVVFKQALDAEADRINKFYNQKEEEISKEYISVFHEFSDFESEFPYDSNDAKSRDQLKKILRSLLPNYQDINEPADHLSNHDENGHTAENNIENFDHSIDQIESLISPRLAPNGNGVIGLPHESHMESVDDLDSLRLQKKKSFPTLFYDDDFHVTFLEALKVEKKPLITRVFTHISELKSFIELNKIGFGKALKKFDKLLQTNIKSEYLSKLENDYYVFKNSTIEQLNAKISDLVTLYSIFTHHNINEAKLELGTNLREKVVFERNTVWRDMIGLERKSQAAYAKPEFAKEGAGSHGNPFTIKLGAGRQLTIPGFLTSLSTLKIVIIALITLVLLNISPFEDEQQKNCFAVLICSSLSWATEAIPLFTTSLLLPFLLVVLKVLKNPETGEVFSAPEASKFICAAMWSPIILLLLGGFTLAAALSKHNLDKYACTFLLSKVQQRPAPILFAIMVVSTIIAAFVSNVAAPVLMYSVVQPILNTLTDKTVNGKTVQNEFAQALVLGIALASSVAGMASPIASPQNVVALQFMDPPPNWIQWFSVSIPVCACCLVLIFIVLMISFSFKDVTIVPIHQHSDNFSSKQYFVLAISLVTIVLWCLASVLEPWLGDMGQIALISMVTFYATGALSQEDFNNYPWTIVILAMGGLALGKAVTVSGLLTTIANLIQKQLEDAELFTILAVFGFIVLIMATFVSHTVAALIIIPLIAEIGRSLPDPHPNILVFCTSLICSCAMGLPTSGFPNVTAIGLTNNLGDKYLNVGTFIRIGVPTSLGCLLIVITVGYLCLRLIGF